MLRRAYFRSDGLSLVALDYLNPDCASEDDMRHLIISKGQVHQCTPEEVYNYSRDCVRWGPSINQAAVVDLGKSEWLRGFSQHHLDKCRHYRIMFYDEFVDLICENISGAAGRYSARVA